MQEVFNIEKLWKDDRLPSGQETRALVLEMLEVIRAAAPDHYRDILRYFMLEELDRCWKEHLLSMDHLRDGIGLRGYGQRDPKQEYKREGFALFQEMLERIKENLFKTLTRLRLQPAEAAPEHETPAQAEPQAAPQSAPEAAQEPQPGGQAQQQGASPFRHKDTSRLSYSAGGSAQAKAAATRREAPKVGRNDDCPCGSGKKYKKCCGMGK